MITRKQAEEVIKLYEQHKYKLYCKEGVVCKKAYYITSFINQFTETPTPDEMLAEMREWASHYGKLEIQEWTFSTTEKPKIIISLSKDNKGLSYRSNRFSIANYREEAIKEAYNRWLKIKGV